MDRCFPQRRDQQTWTIPRSLLPSQLRVKRTLRLGTGGNEVKTGMKSTRVPSLAPQRTGTSSKKSGRARSEGQRPEALRGAAARPRLTAPDLLRLC